MWRVQVILCATVAFEIVSASRDQNHLVGCIRSMSPQLLEDLLTLDNAACLLMLLNTSELSLLLGLGCSAA